MPVTGNKESYILFETTEQFWLSLCSVILAIIKQQVEFISSQNFLHEATALKYVALSIFNEILRATSSSLPTSGLLQSS